MVNLDLSLSPDVFCLRAFDSKLPLKRMMSGSNPCELRLMLPDSTIGADGFHDVVIENLSASHAWRSSHVSPADVKSLCRRWPKAVYSDDAEACEKSQAPPSIFSSCAGVGISSQCASFLPCLSSGHRVGLGRSYDGFPFGVGAVVALPGGVVCGLEGLC